MSRVKALTVGELKEALKDVPNDLEVKLSSDTGVDQGEGAIVVESAERVSYGTVDYFSIYANDIDLEDKEED